MKVELSFKSHGPALPRVTVIIEGEAGKVRELVNAIEKKARKWEGWEEA
jgi:hypothetical protein